MADDYRQQQEHFEQATFQALVHALQGCASEDDVGVLCYHAGFNFNDVKEEVCRAQAK